MSISYCLLIFFLCLSLHACNARRLSDLDMKLEKKFHIFNKNDEKKGIDSKPMAKSSLSNEPGTATVERIDEEQSLADKSQMPKDTKDAKFKIPDDETGKTSGAAQTESLSSVSWRVPHNKRGEKHPGFNSDYSPPKTHPPSHN